MKHKGYDNHLINLPNQIFAFQSSLTFANDFITSQNVMNIFVDQFLA